MFQLRRIIRIGDNKGAPFASNNFTANGRYGQTCGPCVLRYFTIMVTALGDRQAPERRQASSILGSWNIVFMQFNRKSDGTMDPLPKPSVDTGMGLKHITAYYDVNSNYDIDLFRALIKSVAEVTNATDLANKSLRDCRPYPFLFFPFVCDGVIPSNEGRGCATSIIRRAVRHGYMLGAKDTFFYKLVLHRYDVMAEAGKELKNQTRNR